MTNHGFGLGTGSPPEKVEKVIKKLRKLRPPIDEIKWITKVCGEGPDYQVFFTFGEVHPDWDEFCQQIKKETGIKNLSLYKIP